MSLLTFDTGVQRSMQQMQANVAMKSAGCRASLLGLKLLFPNLGHRVKKVKRPHLVCPAEQGGPGLGADGTTHLEFAIRATSQCCPLSQGIGIWL